MRLNDEQYIRFVNDPRVDRSREELHNCVDRIRNALKFDGTAGYYLATLPTLIKRLEEANDQMITVEATVEAEILGQERYHG